MKIIRGCVRFMIFMPLCAYYVARLITASAIYGRTYERAIRIRYEWGLKALKLLAVDIDLEGTVPKGSHLFLANHRSYLDGAIMVKYVLGTFVVKKELERWPIIGQGAKASMAIRIDRKDKESRRDTREQMRKAMENGISVVIFPEGTTYTGPGIGPLKPGPFQVAQEGDFTLVPVAFEYKVISDAWVGNDNFVRHFVQCFGKRKTYVKVKFGNPMMVADWATDMQKVQDWMQQETLRMRAEYDAGK